MLPEEVIGLTIVAISTSLPELATGIMGAIAFIAGDVSVGAHIIGFDMWVMLAATLILIVLRCSN